MAVEIVQQNLRWFDELNNGSDFSINTAKFKDSLAGYAIGKNKVTKDLRLQVRFYQRGSGLVWNTDNSITIDGVDWRKEGFAVGDTVRVRYLNVTTSSNEIIENNVNVNYITADGTIGFESTASYSQDQVIDYLNIVVTSFSDSLIYNFGLVPNEDEYSNVSLLSGNTQTWYGSGMSLGGSAVEMLWLGTIQDDKTGRASIRSVSEEDLNLYYYFNYELEHEFIVAPYYLDGDLTNLIDRVPPDYLKGDASLKYVSQLNFRRELSNPNTNKTFKFDSNLSSIAWFNENFNGFNSLYEQGSFSYIDTFSGDSSNALQVGSKTTFNTTILKSGYNVSTNHTLVAYISRLPSVFQYTDQPTDFKLNWIYDSLRADVFATTTGTGAIKELRVGASDTETITVSLDVEFSNDEQQKIEIGNQYIIVLAVQDNSGTAGNEDAVALLADENTYALSSDISGLATMPQFNIYNHLQVNGFTDYRGWNEDGIYADCLMIIQRDLEAFINTLELKLVTYNPITFDVNELDSYSINWQEIISGGIQQIDVNTSRNYAPSISQEMGGVTVGLVTSDATTATYSIKFGQKITWDTTTPNPNINQNFYDNTKPSSNLNFKSSNYSEIDDYEIRLGVKSNIYGTDGISRSGNTDYLFLSAPLLINDYDTPTDITGLIEVIDVATGTNLGTSPTVDRDSILRVTWSKAGGITENASDWFINRIFDNLTAFESSSVVPFSSGILKALTVSYTGGDVICESVIDYTQLEDGKTYSLSGRCNIGDGVATNAKLKTDNTVKLKTQGDVKLKA